MKHSPAPKLRQPRQHLNQPTVWPIDADASRLPGLGRRQWRLQPSLSDWRTALDPARPQRSSQFSRHPFSATHFLGHCFGLIPASGSFASSAFPVPPLHHWVPSDKAAARFGSRSHSLLGAPRKWGKKKEKIQLCLTYMLSGIAQARFARQRFSH